MLKEAVMIVVTNFLLLILYCITATRIYKNRGSKHFVIILTSSVLACLLCGFVYVVPFLGW